jgi:hypothetical protein
MRGYFNTYQRRSDLYALVGFVLCLVDAVLIWVWFTR